MSDRDPSGRFGGDMDRNEVEIDLNKFMALLQEKADLKDRIRDLEVDFLSSSCRFLENISKSIFNCIYIFTLFYSDVVYGIGRTII
mgnify:CR=1 FL=1